MLTQLKELVKLLAAAAQEMSESAGTAKPLKQAARREKRKYIKRSKFWNHVGASREKTCGEKVSTNQHGGYHRRHAHVELPPQASPMISMVKFNGTFDEVTTLKPGEGVLVSLHRLQKEHKFRNFASAQVCAHQYAVEAGFPVQAFKVCRGSMLVVRHENGDKLNTKHL